tara:strand:+ start:416 stop:625 length:210 start_codon:yes stop_codon:yes gene_type:complete
MTNYQDRVTTAIESYFKDTAFTCNELASVLETPVGNIRATIKDLVKSGKLLAFIDGTFKANSLMSRGKI